MDNERKVTLGCGTLILIALLVLLFGDLSVHRTTKQVIQLRQEMHELRGMVSSQSKQIEAMR
jgi:hypothetical protein